MNILIIGSEGLIGKNLKYFLKEKNYKVYDFDIKNGEDYNLKTKTGRKNLEKIINNIDYVFFLAFDVGGSKYLNNINNINYIENNLSIMRNVFEIIKNKKFMFASSQMQNMYNIYGTLKRLGEHYTNNYNQINVRFWNIYGKEKYNNKSHVITDIIYSAKKYNVINLLTNGNETRQFLYTDDCSNALYKIMINHDEILKQKNIIDVSNFEWTSIYDVSKIVSNIYNCKINITENMDNLQTLKNEPDKFILKYWKPTITLEEGIKKLINMDET